MTVLAIDQGTSGTKAVVVDDPSQPALGAASVPLRQARLPEGGVEQDPAELLASVLEAGRRAVSAAGVAIDAVALSNQGETVLAWDRSSGDPLSAAVGWQDRRAAGICQERRAVAGLVAERTGLRLDPYFSAPKMTWLRQHVDAGVVTTTDTWLLHHLTGAFVTDASTATRSLLTNLDTGDWDPELLEIFGLDGEHLPDIVGCDQVIGTTTAFGSEAPVAGLAVDQAAALLAQSCFDPASAKCTFGTGAFLLANTGRRPVRSRLGLASSIAWRTRGQDTYCLDGQVYTAGAAVRWLQRLGLIGEPQDLDRLAVADAAGVICVPALAGLGGPWWRPDAQARFTGLSLASGREHLVRAVVEGVAAHVAELIDVTCGELGHRITTLRVDGGLTRSASLVQALADIAQLPFEVYPSPDASPLGVAALARMALNPSMSPADAVGGWLPQAVFQPNWTPDRASSFRASWQQALAETLTAGEDG